MQLFAIAYDLNKKKNYQRLIAALEKAGAKRVLYSDWMLRSNSTLQQLFDHFIQYIDDDDALVVAAVENARGIRTFTALSEV